MRPFGFEIAVAPTLTRRVSEMMENLNRRVEWRWSMLDAQTPFTYFAPNGRQFRSDGIQGQPWGASPFDLDRRLCPCGYCYATGVRSRYFCLPQGRARRQYGRSILVIRDKRKRQELVTGPLGGRPCLVGPALTL
ncbi:hypothetical protein GQ600_9069 [Phytophthora cactorum]|nr:hypothetical protein GQ600_9069 [Phytophthora cactorum]